VTPRDDEIAATLRPTFAGEAVAIAERLEEACRDGRREDVRRLAHRLAGSAGTVRELAVVEASRDLEQLADDPTATDATVAAHTVAVLATLREAVATITTASGEAPRPAEPEGDRPVVVAIEDSPANAALLRRIFEAIPGVELVTTWSGRDGARIAVDRRASLVLLDLDLPDVPGEWVLEALRGPDGRVVTNVVIVSGDATPGQARRARGLGATDYVAKPFDIARLRTLVREACLGT
jgi:two-component system, cell cycle response regulator DivK